MKGENDLNAPLTLVGYSDADFAADKDDRKSVTGGYVGVAGMPVAWFTRKQGGVSISTMEAEFTAASVVVAEMIGIDELLEEMGIDYVMPMSLKRSTIKQLLSNLPKDLHQRVSTLWARMPSGIFKAGYREGPRMSADMMTKAHHTPRLEELNTLISLHHNG